MNHFVSLLEGADPRIQEQAAWALGNVAGDSVAMRDYVLNLGVLSTITRLVEQRA